MRGTRTFLATLTVSLVLVTAAAVPGMSVASESSDVPVGSSDGLLTAAELEPDRAASEGLAAAHAESLGYVGAFVEGDRLVLRAGTDLTNIDLEAEFGRFSLEVIVKPSVYTRDQIDAASAAFAKLFEEDQTASGALSYDAVSDEISVSSSLDPKVVEAALRPYRGDSLNAEIGNITGQAGSRTADTTPHYGGSKILPASGGGCTSGFTAYRTVTGSPRVMVTAAHCGPLGMQWRSDSGNHSFGSVQFRNSTIADAALLSGSSYLGRVWVSETTSRIVNGAANPVTGQTGICRSARSGLSCGLVIGSYYPNVCFSGICT